MAQSFWPVCILQNTPRIVLCTDCEKTPPLPQRLIGSRFLLKNSYAIKPKGSRDLRPPDISRNKPPSVVALAHLLIVFC
jgi:hypothetical protein